MRRGTWSRAGTWTAAKRCAPPCPSWASNAPIPGGGTLKDIAAEVLAIARSGLNARGKLNKAGDNETGFLNPLDEIVSSGKVPAQVLLDKFHGEWGGDITRVYGESF